LLRSRGVTVCLDASLSPQSGLISIRSRGRLFDSIKVAVLMPSPESAWGCRAQRAPAKAVTSLFRARLPDSTLALRCVSAEQSISLRSRENEHGCSLRAKHNVMSTEKLFATMNPDGGLASEHTRLNVAITGNFPYQRGW